MNISVRFGSGLAPQASSARLSVALSENATVADLIEYLRSQHPELTARLNVALPVVSGRHVTKSELLDPAQEVAFLLPAAGG